MNLSQLRDALAQARVDPVKTLGQNFLHDQNLARWIVAQAELKVEDFVVEIGPGLGALTGEILASGARLLALEKDGRLVAALRENFSSPNFEVVHGDALSFDPRPLFAERNVKIIGNLPYYIASQLLLQFAKYPPCNNLMLFMLQEEMARRLAAVPGSPDYGALSVRVQLHYRVEYLRKIPATVFHPRPEVDSAIVRLTPKNENESGVRDVRHAHRLIRLGFSQRRKQLRKLLSEEVPAWEDAAVKIGFLPAARAEELSLKQWVGLANLSTDKNAGELVAEKLTVVDATDREIGEETRAKVHENNLRHRAVHLFLFNSKGELLLQKRSATKDRHPLVWDSSAAGHVDAKEAYEISAVRELEEELGIRADLKLIGKLPASEKTGQEFIHLFQGWHDGPFNYPPEEISAVEFFPTQLIDRWAENKPEEFAPGFLECWRLWKTSMQSGDLRGG